MKSGIYKIANIFNGECYIGSAVDIDKRWRRHKNDLQKNKHHSILLQRAWNKYGEELFEFEILENCAPSMLISREQYLFDTLKPKYNISRIAGSNYGCKWTLSEESKRRISESLIGRKLSIEHKRNLSLSHLGKATWMKGKRHSEESKMKNRLAHTGIANV